MRKLRVEEDSKWKCPETNALRKLQILGYMKNMVRKEERKDMK